MPRALDTSLLRMAGRPQPPAPSDHSMTAAPPVDTSADQPAARRRRTPTAARAPRKAQSIEPNRERLKPTGASLTEAQLSWLYKVEGEALGQQRRVSHSEIVRLAIDRQRQRDMNAVVAEIEQASECYAPESTFALTAPQLRWLRAVKGHALLHGENVSQADVIRAAVQALVGSSWNDLGDEADQCLRPRGRPRAAGSARPTR